VGNILRVATTEVLAKESETQKVINDSRLDASPLVTEFIRLNYARASGTLAQAADQPGPLLVAQPTLALAVARVEIPREEAAIRVYCRLFQGGFHAVAPSKSMGAVTR